MTDEIAPDEELAKMGLGNEDLAALENVQNGFLGFRCRKSMAPQSAQCPDSVKSAALAAIGGGDVDSIAMSDKLFSKDIASVKKMNEAVARVNALTTDRWYTLPHPEPGIRLVKKGKEEELRDAVEKATFQITAAAQEMNADRENIKEVMRGKLQGRYEKHAAIYNLDFTKLYVVTWKFPNLDVPDYLKHSEKLYAEAEATAMSEAAEVVKMEKIAMAKTLFGVIDHLCERLESVRMLDRKHEVIEADLEGDEYTVTYLPQGQKMQKKNYDVETMSVEEFEKRVKESSKKRVYTNATAGKVFDELDYATHQLEQTGIGAGELEEVFASLRQTVQGQDKSTFAGSLRESQPYREAMERQMGRLGNAVLGISVLKGQRDVIRGGASSRRLNPEKH